jgi:hypothetical protein
MRGGIRSIPLSDQSAQVFKRIRKDQGQLLCGLNEMSDCQAVSGTISNERGLLRAPALLGYV